jgi:hypothetical protein
MNEHEFDRAARAWLDDGPTRMSDRALSSAFQKIHSTRQRRALGPAWRTNRMNAYATLVAAAAVLAVAIGSYQLLPGIAGPGGSPSPSPALLARGSFVIRDWDKVDFEATRQGPSVSGHMTVGQKEGTSDFLRVDLRCARTTEDGFLMIGGYTNGAGGRFARDPGGTLAAIVLKHGSPVKAQIWHGSLVNFPGTQTLDCVAYLDAWFTWSRTSHPGDDWLRDDIDGTVEFGP